MAKGASARRNRVYQLKITLKGVRPPIWRRVQVLGSSTLKDLSDIIQNVMDWGGGHLHEFEVGGIRYGIPYPDPLEEGPDGNEAEVSLADIAPREKSKSHYLYDFGDSWDHEILVEKVLPPEPGVKYPVCLAGRRAAPPDDCGGPWGYASYLAILADPDSPDYEEVSEWMPPDWDPERFDLDEVNRRIHERRPDPFM